MSATLAREWKALGEAAPRQLFASRVAGGTSYPSDSRIAWSVRSRWSGWVAE
jgi:hypothetical protein